MKVYLDDKRVAPEGWTQSRWSDEAIELLKTGKVTEISLDHDLGDDTRGTGYDVILWIEEKVATEGFKPPIINVHSANTSARQKMEQGIQSIYKLYKGMEKEAQTAPCYKIKLPDGKVKYVTPTYLIMHDFKVPYGTDKHFKPRLFKPAPMSKCQASERRTGDIEIDVKRMLDKYPFNEVERLDVDKYFQDIRQENVDVYYEVWKYAERLFDDKVERGEVYGPMTEELRKVREKLGRGGVNILSNEEYEILFKSPHPRKQIEEIMPNVMTEEEAKKRGLTGALVRLVVLADHFDSKGLQKQADEVDDIINIIAKEYRTKKYKPKMYKPKQYKPKKPKSYIRQPGPSFKASYYVPSEETKAPSFWRRNYDYGEGMYMTMDKHKSVKDYLEKRRKGRAQALKQSKIAECLHQNTIRMTSHGFPIEYCLDCEEAIDKNKRNRGDWSRDYFVVNVSPYNDIGFFDAKPIDKIDYYS